MLYYMQGSASFACRSFRSWFRFLFIFYFGGECVNIKEIAQLAGVSVATISRVLNHPEQVLPETRKRVLAIMEANDYTPNWFARGLNLGRTNTIALLLPNIQSCLYQRIFSGVETVARSKQYVVLSCHTHGDPALECDYLKTAQTRRIDGVILVATALDEERLQPFLHARVPCVHVGRTPIRALESQCYLDFEEGAYRLTQHMLELGHKAVGLLLDDPPSVEAQQVHSGCDQALLEAGCPPAAVCLGENSIQGGYFAAQKLFRGGQPPSTLNLQQRASLWRFKGRPRRWPTSCGNGRKHRMSCGAFSVTSIRIMTW